MLPPAAPLAVRWAGLLEGDPRWPLALACGLGAGVWLFLRGFGAWRQLRLVEDTPRSKARSLALGRAELGGRAAAKGELRGPFTGRECVWYRWRIEEESRTSRHRHWRTLAAGSSDAWPFYVEDETGRVLVDPRGARVEVPGDLCAVDPPLAGPIAAFLAERGIDPRGFLGLRRRLRFSEWHIAPGEEVYVLGVAQERGGIVHERRERIRQKLAALRADPEAMAHLDLDGDGHVSGDEWDVARQLVVREAELAGFADRVVLGADEHGATPFTITARAARGLVRQRAWRAAGGVFGGAGLALACLAGLLGQVGLLQGGG